MVPKGWTAGHVSDICRLQNGRGFKPEDWKTEGLPIIRIQNLNGSQNFNYFSGVPEKKWVVEPGQMLFAWAGTKGVSFGPTVWRGDRGVLNQHIFKVFQSEDIDHDWLYLALRHVTDRIEGRAHGFKATLVHVKKSDIEKQPIAIPPFPEQRKIAEILSTWDRAVETAEALLATARTQKRALMQTLLTGKRRFPQFEGQEWREMKLGEAEAQGWLKLNRGKVISKKDISTCPGNYPIYSSSVVGVGEFGQYAHYMFDEELITWSVDGGGHFFHRKKHKFSVTNVCGWMRIDTTILNYAFMAAQLQFLHQQLQFDYQSKAHPSVIRNIYSISIPSLKEQEYIGKVAADCDDEIIAMATSIEKLRTEKKALMQQLLTGNRRVQV